MPVDVIVEVHVFLFIILRFSFMVGVRWPPSTVHGSGVSLNGFTFSHLAKFSLASSTSFSILFSTRSSFISSSLLAWNSSCRFSPFTQKFKIRLNECCWHFFPFPNDHDLFNETRLLEACSPGAVGQHIYHQTF